MSNIHSQRPFLDVQLENSRLCLLNANWGDLFVRWSHPVEIGALHHWFRANVDHILDYLISCLWEEGLSRWLDALALLSCNIYIQWPLWVLLNAFPKRRMHLDCRMGGLCCWRKPYLRQYICICRLKFYVGVLAHNNRLHITVCCHCLEDSEERWQSVPFALADPYHWWVSLHAFLLYLGHKFPSHKRLCWD